MIRLPRLRRRTFWLAVIAAWVVFFAVRETLGLEQIAAAATAWASLMGLALLALATSRLHDRGRSAWALAAALLPVAGPLWLGWELACRRGTRGTNRYGPDPHTH
jgi:uncharacterized membrane protein YhaH (DUF805 family)